MIQPKTLEQQHKRTMLEEWNGVDWTILSRKMQCIYIPSSISQTFSISLHKAIQSTQRRETESNICGGFCIQIKSFLNRSVFIFLLFTHFRINYNTQNSDPFLLDKLEKGYYRQLFQQKAKYCLVNNLILCFVKALAIYRHL